MSGANRVLSRTAGSIFLAAANASALSRMADSALRPISNVGSDARDIENDMRLFLDLVNWRSRIAPPDDERDRSVFQVYAGASALPFILSPPAIPWPHQRGWR